MPRILSWSRRISLRMCVPFFQGLLSSCAAPRVHRFFFAKPPQYYSCSVVCWSYAAVCCLSTRYVFGAFVYQVSCSVSVSFLQPYACPALWRALCVPFMPSMGLHLLSLIPVEPHQSVLQLWLCFWLFQWYVTGMFQLVADKALLSPCPSRLLLSVRVQYLFWKNTRTFTSLRGLRWPEGNERFRVVSGACSKFRKL